MVVCTGIAPFRYVDGRLRLEDVDLAELAAALDGRAAWVISHGAVALALARAGKRGAASPTGGVSTARIIDIASVGAVAVMTQIAAAGWWARVRSSHELQLALAGGFPAMRVLAAGGVRDDGFVKDALGAGVAAMDHEDATERANAARIAALLGHELPPEGRADEAGGTRVAAGAHVETGADAGAVHSVVPPDTGARLFAHGGGLLAPVLRPPPALAVDVVLPPLTLRSRSLATVLSLRDGAESDVSLAGLDEQVTRRPGRLRGPTERGDWVLIPRSDAAGVHAGNAAHVSPHVVLVRGASWRLLESRPLPASSG